MGILSREKLPKAIYHLASSNSTRVFMRREGVINGLSNMRGTLADLASPDFASQMAIAPVNGFIDSRELHNMCLDMYCIFDEGYIELLSDVSAELVESVRN
jgi:hypothetical protein